jgi:hypothetical protein
MPATEARLARVGIRSVAPLQNNLLGLVSVLIRHWEARVGKRNIYLKMVFFSIYVLPKNISRKAANWLNCKNAVFN